MTILRKEKGQAVSTVNSGNGYDAGILRLACRTRPHPIEPRQEGEGTEAAAVGTEGTGRSQVRRLLREVELREDIRAVAIFSLMLYTGARVSDLVNLELADLLLGERSGTVVFGSARAISSEAFRCLCLPEERFRSTSNVALPLRIRGYSLAREGH